MATAVSTQLSALTGSNTVQQMMSDVNSLKTLSALATDAAGSGDFVPTSGGNFTGNVGIEKNGATSLTLTRTNGASNFAAIEAAGSSGEQLTIKSNVSNQTGGFTSFDVGGSERVRIDSSGHVLIGTNNSTTDLGYQRKLKISGTGVALYLEETDESQAYAICALSGNLIIRDATNLIARMTLDSSGNIGIATTTTSKPASKLNVAQGVTASSDGSVTPYFQFHNENAGTDLKRWRLGGLSSGSLTFDTVNDAYNAAVTHMRIDSSGNIGMGTSVPNSALHIYKQTNDRTARFQRISTQTLDIIQTASLNEIASSGKDFIISTVDVAPMLFNTAGTERMRIRDNGAITFKQGVVDLQSASGNPAQMNFYCESGNAHYTRIQSAPHASYSGNVVLTLPTTSGTLATTASAATTGKAIAMAIVFG